MQMMTLSVLQQVNKDENKYILFFFFLKKKRQLRVSSDRALSIQPLVCASLGAFQDLDSTSSLHPPAVSNLPMC